MKNPPGLFYRAHRPTLSVKELVEHRYAITCYTCMQTTLTSSIIRNLSPQLWHQFRITAVNIYGSQGPSEPSSPFSLLFGLSKYLRFSNNNNNNNDDDDDNNNNYNSNNNHNHNHNLDNDNNTRPSVFCYCLNRSLLLFERN